MLFSKRLKYENKFIAWCKKNKCAVCPGNMISWMQAEKEGKKLASILYKENVERS